MKVVALIAVCLASGVYARIDGWGAKRPQWPDTWTAAWNEEMNYTGAPRYTGGYGMYDWPNGHLVWTRYNGAADPVCNSSIPLNYDTPCSHIITNNTHFLYTPNLEQCCSCCTAEQGCGMPSPFTFSNFSYSRQSRYYGLKVYEWEMEVNGFDVTYLETTEKNPTNRSWVGLLAQHDSYTYVWNFTGNADTSGFQLPAACWSAKYCPVGACAAMRNTTSFLRTGRSLLQEFL